MASSRGKKKTSSGSMSAKRNKSSSALDEADGHLKEALLRDERRALREARLEEDKANGSSPQKRTTRSAPSSPARKPAGPQVSKGAVIQKETSTEKEPTSVFRLMICFLGINVCYMYYGVIQERLFRPDPRANNQRFDNTLFLFGVQSLMNAMFALGGRTLLGSSSKSTSLFQVSKTAPLRRIFPSINGWAWLGFISASYLLAMLTSNEALRYVSYPVQALAKSCKMVPVMIGNALVGVKYKWYEYMMVLMITVGITLSQQSGGSSKQKDSTFVGMVLLFISLGLDGITGSHQHLFDHEYKLSTHDLMLGMNVFAFMYTFLALVATGEGVRGVEYIFKHPWIQQDVFLFGLASALGQNFIFYTITGPGPLACTTITTMRKFFTILLSVFLYEDNQFTSRQWLGVVLVFSGLGAEIVEKAIKKARKKH